MGRGNKQKIAVGVPGNPQLEFDTNILDENSNKQANTNSVKDNLLSMATDETTKKIIKELYRDGATVGDGGTADAVREELKTGQIVGGKSHIQKAKERIRQIEKLLEKNPKHYDKKILEKLKFDLESALKGEG